MTYAFLTDGLDFENKEKFDAALNQGVGDEKAKARREREAIAAAMRFMQ